MCNLLIAQYTFQKAYYSFSNITVSDYFNSDKLSNRLVQTIDNGYLVSGRLVEPLSGNDKAILIKTDPFGELEWVKGFNNINQQVAIMDLKKNLENGYIISTGLGWGGGVMKLDANGDTLWTKHFYDLQSISSIDNTSDSGYVAIGYSLNDYESIIKFNSLGNIMWSKSLYDSSFNLVFNNIRQTFDGGFIISGSGTISNTTSTTFILKLDASGNQQWCKKLSNNTNNLYNYSLDLTQDGGFVLAGSSNSNLSVIRLDSIGDTLWTKVLEATSNLDYCMSIKETSTGDFILGGHIDYDQYGGPTNKMIYFKIDANGNFIWANTAGFVNNNYCSDIIETNDGGYALTGFYSDFTGFSNIPLFKTDEFGAICNGSTSSINLTTVPTVFNVSTLTPTSNSISLTMMNNVYYSDTYPFIGATAIGEVVPEICLVTVDTTSMHNLVVWEKPISLSIDSFLVYREVGSNYIQIGSTPYDSLSQYLDTDIGIDPNVTSYRYKIAQVDTCGNISSLSDFHETIHLTANQGINDEVNLIWDTYEGFSFGTYNILRDSTSSGNWELLGSVNSNNISYIDFNPPTIGASYMIEVVPPSTCTSTKAIDHNSTRSNSGTIIGDGGDPQNILDYDNRQVNIYPNPTKNTITLQFNQIAIPCSITLKDLQGRVVYSAVANAQKLELDFSAYERGIYLIGITNNNFARELKVVRE